ncbi:MAG: hypothetical protein K2Q20_14015, partial [Phycisphaerales bacterium]|nr:hypothetical protein [Phycisphaerales bacterium]
MILAPSAANDLAERDTTSPAPIRKARIAARADTLFSARITRSRSPRSLREATHSRSAGASSSMISTRSSERS